MGRGRQSPYDWETLKTEFVTGHWPTIVSFGDCKGISYQTLRHHSSGWREMKTRYQAEVRAAAVEKTAGETVISTEEQGKLLTDVLKAMLKQYKDMSAAYDEKSTKQGPKHWTMQKIMDAQRKIEKNLKVIGEQIELVSGRATARLERGQIEKDKLEDFDRQQKDILSRIRKISAPSISR